MARWLKRRNTRSRRSLIEPSTFKQKFRLYFYASRFLLERVSWLCRDRFADKSKPQLSGDGAARVVFSNRQSIPYPDLCRYVSHLRTQPNVNIDWSVISEDLIETECSGDTFGKNHKGLQIVDAVASGIARAVEPCHSWTTEDRYAKILSPTFYRHNGRCWGYGIKVFPAEITQFDWAE